MNTKRLISIAGWATLGLAATLFLAVGALAWWGGSESAMRLATQRAEALTGGQLVISGAAGSLYGPLQVESLTYTTPTSRIELKQVRLDWSPWALLQRHLRIDALALQELRVVQLATDAPSEPAVLPDSLQLPLSLSLRQAQVERIVLQAGEAQTVLTGLALALHKPAGDFELTVSGLGTPWGQGQAEVRLADVQPYALSAQLKFAQDGTLPYSVQATAAGSLSRLVLKARADALGGQTLVDATLAPFDAGMPLVEARIEAQGLDPSRLRQDLPAGQFGALVSLRGLADRGLAGDIRIEGAQAGPWDQRRYPLRSLALKLAGSAERLDLSDIRLDLGQAGSFTGSGRVENAQLQLALNTRGFDPRGAYSTLRAMKLSGDIELVADAGRQALKTELRHEGYRLQLAAQHQDELLTIEQALLSAGRASLRVQGTLALAQQQRFSLVGALKQFDPAAFGDFPAARLNASFKGTGQLSPAPEARLEFDIADSSLRGQPLAGQGRLNASPRRLWDSQIRLQLARNRLEARGSFGAPADRLTLTLAADQLAAIDPSLAGRVTATARLAGGLDAPSGDFELAADGLRWGSEHRLGSLRAKGRLVQGLDGPLTLEATAAGLVSPQIQVDQTQLVAEGRRQQHRLALAARNADFDFNTVLAGGWRDAAGWQGELQSLVNRGRFALKLKAPARLEAAPQRLLLTNAVIEVAGGAVSIAQVRYEAGALSSRGSVQGIAAAELQRIAAVATDLQTDLRFGGEWLVEAGERVNGRVELRRESGDLTLPTVPSSRLGLTQLGAGVEIVDNRLRARLAAQAAQFGEVTADAQTLLSRRDGVWGVAGEAPLSGQARLAMPALAWLGPLIDQAGGVVLDGAVQGQARVDGTVAQPRIEASIEGQRLAFALPAEGLKFTDGRLLARWRDDALHLDSFTLKGGDGSLTGQGQLGLRAGEPEVRLVFKADRLQIVSRPDRLLLLSGSIDATASGKTVQVKAALKADRGLIELPDSNVPSPSKDVVVLGREPTAPPQGLPYAMQIDVGFDLGDRFFLKGLGLDAQLGGAIRLTSTDGSPLRANGSIQVLRGAYSGYGQRLDIERGILNFQGPIDNPGLNVVAMRKNQEVEAGVAIAGNAQSPRVSLTSRPDVPDSEKLSWLVLGRGELGSSGQDFNALQAAAGALLSAGQSVSLQQRLAQSAGLDEVGIKGSGGLETAVLTLGKRLSSRAYLSFERGLSGADNLVKINYALSQRISVQAQAGSAAALDLFYTLSFK